MNFYNRERACVTHLRTLSGTEPIMGDTLGSYVFLNTSHRIHMCPHGVDAYCLTLVQSGSVVRPTKVALNDSQVEDAYLELLGKAIEFTEAGLAGLLTQREQLQGSK